MSWRINAIYFGFAIVQDMSECSNHRCLGGKLQCNKLVDGTFDRVFLATIKAERPALHN